MEVLGLEGVRVAGIAACVPSARVANDPKVAAATGIPARRVAPPGVTVLDLCLAAARRVLADTGAAPESFGAILAVSFTQESRMPSLAAQAQAHLGFPKGVLAFDVLQACAGWGYGLYLAGLLVRETGRNVLLLDGDRQSAFLAADDPATASLLSDGGTATVVSAGGDEAAWRFSFLTDGAKGAALRLEKGGTIQMDGFGVFRFVATDVVAFLKDFLAATGRETAGTGAPPPPDLFVPHQPNVYMVRQLAKAVGFDGRTLLSADRFGNLASASVPVTIAVHAARLTAAARPTRVLFSGFGGGLAISAGLIGIPPACRLSVVEEAEWPAAADGN